MPSVTPGHPHFKIIVYLGLSAIKTWISNHVHRFICEFDYTTFKVRACIGSYIPFFYVYLIIYPFLNLDDGLINHV